MFLIFIFVLFLNAPKQIFYVNFVKGDVILERTNTFLKVGDEIFDTDNIKFVSEDALISVLSENGKRDKINYKRPTIKPNSKKSEFVSVLASLLPGRKIAAVRNDRVVKRVSLEDEFEMAVFFGAEYHDLAGITWEKSSSELNQTTTQKSNFLILGKGAFKIVSREFVLDTDNFFFVQTKTNPTQTNKIQHQNKEILMDSTLVYFGKNKKKQIKNNDFELYYQNQKGEKKKISDFSPVFPNNALLKNEIALLIAKTEKNYNKNHLKIFLYEIPPYLSDFYGEPEPFNVKVWLEKELNFVVNF